ncbi:hypothetical protein DL768_000014 [Monosporascus sp. mg162]|nr:hypothetical protein DL768_000014 [Monosporascus sp. mg162]
MRLCSETKVAQARVPSRCAGSSGRRRCPQHRAVDMDVYGAFQLCSIGALAAPVTVQFSRTYFFDPARNLIFLWSSLLFIVCLTIEFFRITPSECTHDEFNNPIFSNAKNFSYNTTCGLTCSEDLGPYSPLRRAPMSNIYVIPSPFYLPFGAGVLLAAACCIPAVLSLVFMWNKILEVKKGINSVTRTFLGVIAVPMNRRSSAGFLDHGHFSVYCQSTFSYTRPRSIISQNGDSGDHMSVNSQFGQDVAFRRQQTWVLPDAGYRRKVARALLKINSYLETATLDRFDDSGFRRGEALGFPEVPGENYRNPALRRAKEQYKQNREAEKREAENALPDLSRQNSQPDSFARSVSPRFGGEGGSATRTGLSQKPRSSRSTSPVRDRGHRSSTETTNINSSGRENDPSISDFFGASGQRLRSDTLEVPKPTHHNHTRNSGSTPSPAPVSNLAEVHRSPAIVLSSDAGTTSSNNTPISNEPSTGSASEPPAPTPGLSGHGE